MKGILELAGVTALFAAMFAEGWTRARMPANPWRNSWLGPLNTRNMSDERLRRSGHRIMAAAGIGYALALLAIFGAFGPINHITPIQF